MDRNKVSTSELIAGIGGLVLLIGLLFFNWYGISIEIAGITSVGGSFGAWDGAGFLGVIANLVILATALAGIALALTKAMSKSVTMPVALSTAAAGGAIVSVVFIVLRMIFRPGGEGVGSGVGLRFGIFVALVGALIQAYGGWKAMQEEGTSFSEARDQVKDAAGGAGSGPEPSAPSATPPPPSSPPPTEGGSDEPSSG